MTLASIVDTGALLKSVVASMIAGIGVTIIFSVALLGAIRSLDYGREGRGVAAAAAGALAVLALAATAAAVTFGIVVMTSK